MKKSPIKMYQLNEKLKKETRNLRKQNFNFKNTSIKLSKINGLPHYKI